MAGVMAARVDDGFVVSVPFEVAEEFVDALGVLGERLIGEVPPVLREVESALRGAGEPVGGDHIGVLDTPRAGAIAGYFGWLESAQGLAADHRTESFLAYMAGQQERRRRLLRVWLDRYAEDFGVARALWERDWVETLEEEFAQQDEYAA
jgi:hypothetical protein